MSSESTSNVKRASGTSVPSKKASGQSNNAPGPSSDTTSKKSKVPPPEPEPPKDKKVSADSSVEVEGDEGGDPEGDGEEEPPRPPRIIPQGKPPLSKYAREWFCCCELGCGLTTFGFINATIALIWVSIFSECLVKQWDPCNSWVGWAGIGVSSGALALSIVMIIGALMRKPILVWIWVIGSWILFIGSIVLFFIGNKGYSSNYIWPILIFFILFKIYETIGAVFFWKEPNPMIRVRVRRAGAQGQPETVYIRAPSRQRVIYQNQPVVVQSPAYYGGGYPYYGGYGRPYYYDDGAAELGLAMGLGMGMGLGHHHHGLFDHYDYYDDYYDDYMW